MDRASHRLTLCPVDDVIVSTICELPGIQLSNKWGYGRSLIPALSNAVKEESNSTTIVIGHYTINVLKIFQLYIVF